MVFSSTKQYCDTFSNIMLTVSLPASSSPLTRSSPFTSMSQNSTNIIDLKILLDLRYFMLSVMFETNAQPQVCGGFYKELQSCICVMTSQ